MNLKKWVKTANIIGMTAAIILIYWVFAFVLVVALDLRVFAEKLTGIFGMSVFGILALMAAALMLNIMFNLSRIADRSEGLSAANVQAAAPQGRKRLWLFAALFPLLAGLLLGGDRLSAAKKREVMLAQAAETLRVHAPAAARLAAYRFQYNYFRKSNQDLADLNRLFKGNVSLLVPDRIGQENVFLEIRSVDGFSDGTDVQLHETADEISLYQPQQKERTHLRKSELLYRGGAEQRAYLQKVFAENSRQIRFDDHKGNYELFYPHQVNGKTVGVWLFNERQYYGKFGS
ncbi:hypothetical protein [Conchiformibius kuhniae]|uniref:Peptidase n=1 Tax=Conchiformibius kuhniae TaxID=211502 RepID=A0A8T9MYC0_9NEIS|nr:hypothetical protein [Conchiformibius kuhniae]UOP04853.1 peptidase [Conchiformibius kuhniae]